MNILTELAATILSKKRLPWISYSTTSATRDHKSTSDPSYFHEKQMIKWRLQDSILYVETGGKGVRHATQEELARVNDDGDRIVSLLGTAEYCCCKWSAKLTVLRSASDGKLIESQGEHPVCN